MTTTPVRVTRWSPARSSRSFTCSGSDERRMSKRRCTAFDTLLTFCPPAPCARTAVSSTSDSGITTMGAHYRAGGATVGDGVGRAIPIDARAFDRKVARAWRAVLRRLPLRPIFAALRANVARRRHRLLVRLHALPEDRKGKERQQKKKRACARFFR